MSISGLSYGVVRVEEPGSITSLTLQDVGIVMPGGAYIYVCLYLHLNTLSECMVAQSNAP